MTFDTLIVVVFICSCGYLSVSALVTFIEIVRELRNLRLR